MFETQYYLSYYEKSTFSWISFDSCLQVVMMNMIQNCSISKKEKLDDSQGCDLISDLPLSIIHIILGLIPIREAVRTSVLSTQWRDKWTTLPQLEFYNECVSQKNTAASRYGDFITRVLFHHKGPIHKFEISLPCDFQDIDEWILCLSRNDVGELNLDNFCYESYESYALKMHSSLYSCTKLTYLRMFGCELDPPPLTFKGFLFLRFLSLGMVSLSADEIYSLVAACPLLESFELLHMEEFLELKISAPNLKYMHLLGPHTKIWINAPLMTELTVDLTYYKIEWSLQLLKSSACDYAKCFGGFADLQKLIGSGHFTEYLSHGIELSHHSLVFRHLELIDLDDVNFENVKEIQVVAHLVIGAPNLQVLKISAQYNFGKDEESDSEATLFSFRDLGCPSNFKMEKLTDVSLINASCFTLELKFLRFLLESSPALETTSVVLQGDTEEKRNNLRAKLEGCNWASPTVKLCNVWRATLHNTPKLTFPWDFWH